MRQQNKAYAYALTTVLLWSTVASAFKLTLRYLDYAQLLLCAGVASLVVLGIVLIATGRFGLVFRCTRKQYAQSLGLGLLNPFIYYLVLFKAYDLLPAQVAQPLNYTWALTLALLSIPLLKQKIGRREILAGVICYSGVVVISTRGGLSGAGAFDPLGVALALGSTLIWALFWIQHTRDERDPEVCLFLNFLFGLPFILAYCLLFSSPVVKSLPGLAGAAYVGVVEMGLAFVFWLRALRLSVNTARIGNLIFLSPFLSLVFIRFTVGERILASTLVGLVLIVAGLLFQQLSVRGANEGDDVIS